ncbi:hypothetical protein [Streptomyces sp. NPDC006134]|uniref:hypothetical protein n=1 Tax=Streptomyces sp. NPDC006134 TaxID=3154467 RepID=UPI0033C24C7E
MPQPVMSHQPGWPAQAKAAVAWAGPVREAPIAATPRALPICRVVVVTAAATSAWASGMLSTTVWLTGALSSPKPARNSTKQQSSTAGRRIPASAGRPRAARTAGEVHPPTGPSITPKVTAARAVAIKDLPDRVGAAGVR